MDVASTLRITKMRINLQKWPIAGPQRT
jgi:hypothetical protein